MALGDIVKVRKAKWFFLKGYPFKSKLWKCIIQLYFQVTPSSKVVGDLAQFMVQNNLTQEMLVEQAGSLSLPGDVLGYLEGKIGPFF